jgi:uncharacterized OB-fold protein
MVARQKKPVAEGLFTWPSDSPQLIGARCQSCGCYFFPSFSQFHKVDCEGGPVEQVLLSKRGKVVTYSCSRYPPPWPFKPATPYVPTVYATVALPEGIAVVGHMTGVAFEAMKPGLEVELVVDDLCVDDDGSELLVWKFRPVA